MPISIPKKLMFVHIPKTGGQTVLRYLKFEKNYKNFYGKKKHIREDTKHGKKTISGIEYSHYTLNLYKKYLNLKEFKYSFSFVRNPFDRLVSEFHWRIRSGISFWPLLNIELNLNNFEMFVQKLSEYKMSYSEENLILECHYYPQTKFIFLDSYFKNNKKNAKVEFIGRFENFEEDLKKIGSIYNIDHVMPWKNYTVHENYKSFYNAHTKKLVEKIYETDLNNFNYIF
jgi:hypothetical protein